MKSLIQALKFLITGREIKGINFRTKLSLIITVFVLIIEVICFCIKWDKIPDMLDYDYNFDGVPNNVFNKKLLWLNLLIQAMVVFILLKTEPFLRKIKKIKEHIIDYNSTLLDKRIHMFFVESAALFVTTEQSYIFSIAKIVQESVCDDIVTVTFLFWLLILISELFFDIKYLKNASND